MMFDFVRARPYRWGDAYIQEGFYGWQIARDKKTKASPTTPRNVTWYFASIDQAAECGPDYDLPIPEEL